MKNSNDTLEVTFVDKEPCDYLKAQRQLHCSICGRVKGESVGNGVETSEVVEIFNIVADRNEYEYNFSICSKHLKLFNEIVAMAVVLAENTDTET